MDKATIEITKEEAALLPLLYKVPLNTTMGAASQVMKYKALVDGLVMKVKQAFTVEAPKAEPPAALVPKRKRH
jgi:hypothetical protein